MIRSTPSLMRPGRFDRHVLVDRPDIGGREEILKVHGKNVKLAKGVELNRIAAITPVFAGADLANLVNEAALLAARVGKNSVGMDEFNDGVERVTAGLEKKNRIMNDDEKQRVAYHESGHALVAYSLPNTSNSSMRPWTNFERSSSFFAHRKNTKSSVDASPKAFC